MFVGGETDSAVGVEVGKPKPGPNGARHRCKTYGNPKLNPKRINTPKSIKATCRFNRFPFLTESLANEYNT